MTLPRPPQPQPLGWAPPQRLRMALPCPPLPLGHAPPQPCCWSAPAGRMQLLLKLCAAVGAHWMRASARVGRRRPQGEMEAQVYRYALGLCSSFNDTTGNANCTNIQIGMYAAARMTKRYFLMGTSAASETIPVHKLRTDTSDVLQRQAWLGSINSSCSSSMVRSMTVVEPTRQPTVIPQLVDCCPCPERPPSSHIPSILVLQLLASRPLAPRPPPVSPVPRQQERLLLGSSNRPPLGPSVSQPHLIF